MPRPATRSVRSTALRREVQERLHLVAQMVVARVVGGGDLARVRAGAHDHRRLQPVAELKAACLTSRRTSGIAGTTKASWQHPGAREIHLER